MVEKRWKNVTYCLALFPMNLRVVPGLAAWIACSIPSTACGPFFPDTVLDQPQASLGVPPFSYLSGLAKLAGRESPGTCRNEEVSLEVQIPLEVEELQDLWRAAGVAQPEIEARVKHYEAVRKEMLGRVLDVGLMEFKTKADVPLELVERPLGPDFPSDIADYTEGARLHGLGKTEEARAVWKEILERPAADRRLRSVWAAWMLAKTSADLPECLAWYERVEKEAAGGATDVLGLAGAAMSWRAARLENPIEGIRLFFEAYQHGKNSAARDLRGLVWRLIEENNPEKLALAAGDPILRSLVNLEVQASNEPAVEWLAALEAHAPLPLADGSRIAWALYSNGRYSEARHWLDLSAKDDPMSLWLQAKFDLRSGQLDAANEHLSKAIQSLSKEQDWRPLSPTETPQWYSDAPQIRGATQGRLLADAGMVALAREDYFQALDSLHQGGYEADAAYVAEFVLTTDELTRFVRLHVPSWKEPAPAAEKDEAEAEAPEPREQLVDPATALTMVGSWSSYVGEDNRLRWQLARRLAREGKLKEAREFMPPDLVPLWDHYLKLDTARRNEKSEAAIAALTWRQARLHRHWGAELFSSDTAPDSGIYGWSFFSPEFGRLRTNTGGWSMSWEDDSVGKPSEFAEDRPIPAITSEEQRRVASHPMPNPNRFHYRYVAADLAWEAARHLPDNDPSLAPLYNTAGQWLAARDPMAADRFYQAIVRRCKLTEMGQAADKKRWFIQDAESLEELPGMPQGMIPAAAPE
jgi:tetratricopeptide (TPR) repeat protein